MHGSGNVRVFRVAESGIVGTVFRIVFASDPNGGETRSNQVHCTGKFWRLRSGGITLQGLCSGFQLVFIFNPYIKPPAGDLQIIGDLVLLQVFAEYQGKLSI
jgi:hypothetical protein